MQHIAGTFPLCASASMPATLSTNVHRTSNTEASAFNPRQQPNQAKPSQRTIGMSTCTKCLEHVNIPWPV